jgi:hypothetical protein
MKLNILVLLLSVLLLSVLLINCSTIKPVKTVERVNYNINEASNFIGQGNSSLTGKAFAVDIHGVEHLANGNRTVWLIPKTSMSDQWYNVIFLERNRLTKPDPRTMELVKYTKPDNNGGFSFNSIKQGHYYLVTYVGWGVTVMVESDIPYKQFGEVFAVQIHIKKGNNNFNVSNRE